MNFSFKSIIFIFLSYFLVTGCSKDTGSSSPSSSSTTGTTAEITEITSSTATCGGTIKSGGPEVLEKGVCWGTSTKPLYTVNFTSDGPGSGTFTSSITGLTASTKYYVRMYVTTEDGTTYGNEKNFITKPGGSGKDPVLTTALITGETSTTAETGGVISSKGASDIKSRGVCWSTTSNPTISGNKTSDGTGTGTFSSSITGLTASTKYYVRAYATNDEGTGYGSERSFTTLAGGSSQTPALTTTTETNVTSTTASSGGVISSDGGSSIISRGVCWSTTANPTISGNKTSDGTGTGTFSSSITGLTANTKYYIRAYGTNTNGTGYGSEKNFTTLAGGSGSSVFNPNLTYGNMTDQDGNTYKTIQIGTQTWMAENLKTSKYRDGSAIPTGLSTNQWSTTFTDAYGIYGNNADNNTTYGKLYRWYAVKDSRNLCPTGWHVPTDVEWTTLINFLGGEAVAGGKMKSMSSLWFSPNTGATNSSGFSGLPGGMRNASGNDIYSGYQGLWWSSSESPISTALERFLSFSDGYISQYGYNKQVGFSVRCLKD